MKFHDPPSQWIGKIDVGRLCESDFASVNPVVKPSFLSIYDWNSQNRPYYKCWPHIIEQLSKMRLDYTLRQLDLPERVILLRFAGNGEPRTRHGKLHTILTSVKHVSGCAIFSTLTELECLGKEGFQVSAMWQSHNETIEEYVESHLDKEENSQYIQLMSLAFKVAVSCHLLADDPDIIEPDVLADDEKKYAETKDGKYIEKAKRRGKYGFHVGRNVEHVPHFRTGYFGLRWTGKGGAVPRMVWVRQCLVHREKTARIPTGWLTENGQEIEMD